jgi:hypothetical protein
MAAFLQFNLPTAISGTEAGWGRYSHAGSDHTHQADLLQIAASFATNVVIHTTVWIPTGMSVASPKIQLAGISEATTGTLVVTTECVSRDVDLNDDNAGEDIGDTAFTTNGNITFTWDTAEDGKWKIHTDTIESGAGIAAEEILHVRLTFDTSSSASVTTFLDWDMCGIIIG